MAKDIELTPDQVTAIKKKLGTNLPADEAALLEGLLLMATTHPEVGTLAWHYMIPTKTETEKEK